MPTKVHLVKAMVCPVVMYGCQSWTIKKAERWRIDAFGLWSWRRLLRVPWIARRSNRSIIKEISPEYSLEGLMLKLKLQYFGHLMRRADSLKKTLMLGKIEGRRRRGWQRMRWLDGITDLMGMSLSKLQDGWWTGRPGVLQSMGSRKIGHNWGTEQQQFWKTVRRYFKNLKIELPYGPAIPLLDIYLKKWVKFAQSCLTLCDPMDYRVYGILQAKTLEWVIIPFSRGSSQPRDWTQVSRIAGGFFTSWATREENKNTDLKRYTGHYAHCSIIYNS